MGGVLLGEWGRGNIVKGGWNYSRKGEWGGLVKGGD